ncbi:alpha/beta hydrolase family protein [Reyranella sp.]|uniref:alpha/beta hydrolase family protein n=1 Tax=Reyranella sp. TaxID=1929291 RepID=UPI003D0A0E20
MVPVFIDGEQVKLAVITYKPAGDGPFPTLVFHHGSTGRGDNPSYFAHPSDPKLLAGWFTTRGWAVLLPSRRGRGGSEGLYDEGFSLDRTGYSCNPTLALPGADRALRDIDAVTPVLLSQPFVDRTRVAVGGQSRGGILSIAWSGHRPATPRAVINFVGGWTGARCRTASTINQNLFIRGAAFAQPTIWLYGENDPFYPLWHSRSNFAAFEAAGGKGTFHEYGVSAVVNGHDIATVPSLWSSTLQAYLEEHGLPARAK